MDSTPSDSPLQPRRSVRSPRSGGAGGDRPFRGALRIDETKHVRIRRAVVVEAGPTASALARKLAAVGVDCVVCAPGLIPRAASDRVKTDRRDAERLVRLRAAGELHPVAVPSVQAKALRDLVRAREDLRGDLMRARHGLAKLLLRHEVRFDGPQANWTQAPWVGRPPCLSSRPRLSRPLRTIAAQCLR